MKHPETVGVIGAGTMGSCIAQTCAVAGLAVAMIDVDEAAVARGRSAVSSSISAAQKLPFTAAVSGVC